MNKTQIHNAAPIIIAGMHRSGTSLAASLLHAAGVNMGRRMMPPDIGNVKGHFEDADFVDLHRAMLQQAGLHPTGWTTRRAIPVSAEMRAQARALIEHKITSSPGMAAGEGASVPAWGWKDPRTSLFLDFWAELLPQAIWLFLYRAPWEVADSLFRRGSDAGVLDADPRRAFEYWLHYNQLVLLFLQAHRGRCLLVSNDALVCDADAMRRLLNECFSLQLRLPEQSLYDPALMHREVSASRWPGLVARLMPECASMYEQLEQAADLRGAPAPVASADDAALARLLAEDWYAQWRQTRDVQAAERRCDAVTAERDRHAGRADRMEKHAANLSARLGELEQHADNLQTVLQMRDQHVRNLEKRSEDMHKNTEKLRQVADDARQDAQALRTALDEKSRHAANLVNQSGQRKLHADNLEILLAAARRRVEELQQHAANLEAQSAERKRCVDALEKVLAESRRQVANLESLLAEARNAASAAAQRLADETARSQASIAQLERRLAETAPDAQNPGAPI